MDLLGIAKFHLQHSVVLMLHPEMQMQDVEAGVQLRDISIWSEHHHLMRWISECQGKRRHVTQMQKAWNN